MDFFKTLKDPARLSQILATLFLLGILVSAYTLYQLPQHISLSGQDATLVAPQLNTLYSFIAITFVLGLGAVGVATQVRKETVVYLEKKRSDEENKAKGKDGESTESKDISSFRNLMSQSKDKEALQVGLNEICRQIEAGQGAIYISKKEDSRRLLELKFGFALNMGESQTIRFEFGEGLVGQAAASAKSLYLDEVPEGYIKVVSGLGSASPRYLFIVALKSNNEVKGIIELATFNALSEATRRQLEEMGQVLADKIS